MNEPLTENFKRYTWIYDHVADSF